MWFTLGFAGACTFCAYSWKLKLLVIPAAAFAILAVLLLFGSRKIKPLRGIAAACIGCALGLLWISAYSTLYLHNAAALDGSVAKTVITCTDYSVSNDYGAVAEGFLSVDGKPYRVRVYLNDDLETKPADRLSGTFRFLATTPDGQKASAYRQSEGVFLIAYERSAEKLEAEGETPFWVYPAAWREQLRLILEASFPEDTVGFARAILLGDRRGIDYETNTAFKVSGISHIIAVSGLHVSILCALIYRFCLRKRHLVALVGIPILILFAAITGFSPSITRAVVMQILVILGMALDREYDGMTALAFSCLLMTAINPLVVTSVGLQLSAGCMAGIFLFQEPISDWAKRIIHPDRKGHFYRTKKWICHTISATFSSMSLTMPLVAYYFGTVSLVGVLTNLLTLWVLSAVFYGILLVCAAAWICPAACSVIAWVISWPIRYILGVSKLLASVPIAAVYTKSVYVVIWLVFCYILLAIFCMDQRRKPLLLTCCATIGLCAALCLSWMDPLTDDYRITVLNVGQGQSILMQSRDRTFLVDCGGSSDTATADIAAETLLSQGTNHLDGIILTHYDRDHAGGLPYFLTRISADWLLVPENPEASEQRKQLEALMAGQVITVSEACEIAFDDTVLSVYPPVLEKWSNENSLCVLFRDEKYATLITGDRESFGERVLLKQAELPEVDVLIAGHHGSESSSTRELLDAIHPKFAFISVGENSYGQPSPEVLGRLHAYGCNIYRTDLNGKLEFRR